MKRFISFATRALGLGLLAAAATAALAQPVTLRVGDQRGNARAVMEAAGVLQNLPYKVEWSEFPNAAPLLEALRADAIDAGSVGDAPLTFAAAAGLQAKAIFASSYDGNAVLVANAAPYKSIADLKGKRIAVVKGSSGHNLLLQVLTKAGLSPDAVTLAFLAPSEATLALTQGSVDAVVTWEPYVSFATQKSGARILVDGKSYPAVSYFVASDKAIKDKKDALKDFVARNAQARTWGQTHVEPYSKQIAKLVGIPEDVALAKQRREGHAPLKIDDSILRLQQATVDLYVASGLIPKRLEAQQLLDTSFNP
ncbi:sulfonate transport system substrate-binding protein [Rhodoferax sp. OV413]|uniref:ABC transporter substrate-binding protein n=1 Tax=Rhodoferax sp. OV413 TaxID=1855285 RepID=UPI000880EC28|nr:ABC transporter substrate-binding protein [Rhodoferax sp. OV413]SDP68546.1 sulfonate transport system substrate-binding protein [Rhodoferax sp. OV413]